MHFRRSATHVIGLWEFAHQDVKVEETVDGFPVRAEPDFDPFYSELVIRGLSRMVPGLAQVCFCEEK